MIEDIDSSIGDSNKKLLWKPTVNHDDTVYEVIDGQQRLTTLFLLESYLGMNFAKDGLRFARENQTTLNMLSKGNKNELIEELASVEILKGYQIIDIILNLITDK